MDSKHISFWNEVHTIIDEAVEKHDRSVSVYISPEGGYVCHRSALAGCGRAV